MIPIIYLLALIGGVTVLFGLGCVGAIVLGTTLENTGGMPTCAKCWAERERKGGGS